MRQDTVVVPAFRGPTLVGTALSREADGALTHRLVVDTTSIEVVEVVYRMCAGDTVP
ncbi:MAG: hypothetical protein JNL05_09635 [Flavobacteriales bacterium]|nr:hypothetical protein [Flavobacteriales bacterium]